MKVTYSSCIEILYLISMLLLKAYTWYVVFFSVVGIGAAIRKSGEQSEV